jgi:hypothetical protein
MEQAGRHRRHCRRHQRHIGRARGLFQRRRAWHRDRRWHAAASRPQKLFETYYSYALNSSTHLTFDYQFVNNPAYNTDREPVNVFSSRLLAILAPS